MRIDWQQLNTGMGELLCFVIVWAIGGLALWSNYVGRDQRPASDRVAVISAAPTSQDELD